MSRAAESAVANFVRAKGHGCGRGDTGHEGRSLWKLGYGRPNWISRVFWSPRASQLGGENGRMASVEGPKKDDAEIAGVQTRRGPSTAACYP